MNHAFVRLAKRIVTLGPRALAVATLGLFTMGSATAKVVTFGAGEFAAITGASDRIAITVDGLTLTLRALNNEVGDADDAPLLSFSDPFGVVGIGVDTGTTADDGFAEMQTIDNPDDDEAVEISFDQAVSALTITVHGYATDHSIFSNTVSELLGGGTAGNPGSYRGGNGGGNDYGQGGTLESSGVIGGPDPDPAKITVDALEVNLADPGAGFFVVSAGPSGQTQLIITEIEATVVPLPAALPLLAGALGLIGWVRARRI